MVEKNCTASLGLLGIFLALGLIGAAFVLGIQFKNLRSLGSIEVKGLAEEKFSADLAEWTVGSNIRGADYAEALKKIKEKQPILRNFLTDQGFSDTEIIVNNEEIKPYYEKYVDKEGGTHQSQKGFIASQQIVMTSKDLLKIEKARQAILNFKAQNEFVTYESPQYLLSKLEEIKHSLIAKATQDAHKRAEEFAKTGAVKVGAMREASQGSFNILSNIGNQEGDSWGGEYNKDTVDKHVRLVVTIKYGIEP